MTITIRVMSTVWLNLLNVESGTVAILTTVRELGID